MKTFAVVAGKKEFADYLMQRITKYLGKYAAFFSYSVEEVLSKKGPIEEAFIMVSSYPDLNRIREKIEDPTEIIVPQYAITKEQAEALKSIPEGTKALIVNFNGTSCMRLATNIRDAGIRNVQLVPYWGEGSFDPSIKVAITPNEPDAVPEGMEQVYDIGDSGLDISTLYTIADKIGAYEEFTENYAEEAREAAYKVNSSLERILGDKLSTNEKMTALLKLMKEGILILDNTEKIFVANAEAERLLKERSAVLSGFYLRDVIPELDIDMAGEQILSHGENKALIATVSPIGDEPFTAGHIVTLVDFEESEKKQHKVRSKLNQMNGQTRFNFDDFICASHSIKKCIEEAKDFAAADAPVMIQGESGTGKEMFAQSIHNASHRAGFNFVAVNCSAIPENLLESEMFGYEEGAFTGARKGGKIGYFELAHKGTIFLDEIGEMPLSLQTKLLRALEERKIIHVGGTKNIDVDIRVIAATNEDLEQLVEDGKFRKDLYYRLNVLPLNIPPLRERRSDILPLFYNFLKDMSSDMKIDGQTEKVLQEAAWHGNVRELRNVAEYLISKKKQEITVDDLPQNLKRWIKTASEAEANSWAENTEGSGENPEVASAAEGGENKHTPDEDTAKFIREEFKALNLHREILENLKTEKRPLGRQQLLHLINFDRASENELQANKQEPATGRSGRKKGNCTEAEVRRALSKLSASRYVNSGVGRSGSAITEKGEALLDAIHKLQEFFSPAPRE